MPTTRWSSHIDVAAKAPKNLAGPYVPAWLAKLEQAPQARPPRVDKAETAAHEQHRAALAAVETEPAERSVDEDLGDVE